MTQGQPSPVIVAPPPPPPDYLVTMQVQALTAQQIESVELFVRLEGERISIARQLGNATGAERLELTKQLSKVDGQIDGEKAKIADIKQRIAALTGESPVAGSAGSLLVPQEPRIFGFTQDEVVTAGIFTVLLPLVFVAVRLLWNRGRRAQPMEESDRFSRLEQAVEAVAIEVERIGESQRFQTKLMTERESSPVQRE